MPLLKLGSEDHEPPSSRVPVVDPGAVLEVSVLRAVERGGDEVFCSMSVPTGRG